MSNLIEATDLVRQDLTTAIIRDPITVLPGTTVREAIVRMSGARSHCDADATAPSAARPVPTEARASCVVVVASQKVVGILTERDVVRLCTHQRGLDEILVSQVMTAPVLSLRESDLTDLFAAINVLQQNHIRHLPVVDEQGCLIGLVTHETLRQVLQPTDLLRLRRAREVMTRTVITADPTDSLLAIAQRMASHQVSSVVVVERDRPQDLLIPIGIVTERDLVQFQALELDFERYPVAQVMSHPVIAVPETETLVTVQQLIERYLIRRVVVTGAAGELLGIVTQTNLLKALSPLELYKLTEVLDARVKQLETDKVNLLKHRNLELEEQVASRTQKLRTQLQREQVVAHLATQIRSSLSLQTILDTTVEQIHQMMGCDRVSIWQFEPDLAAVVVADSTDSPRSLLGERVWDECYQQHLTEVYRQGYVRVVPDIYTTTMTNCHREFLISLQTRAKVLIPLFCGEQLWGLLNVSESQTARDWQADEIEMLRTLANQLTIAIQQAATHAHLQFELQERQQAETLLQIKNDLLARVATQEPLTDILNQACIAVEAILDGAVCCILVRDNQNQLRDGAAPSLPVHYRRQIDGVQVGEGFGSCGTAAHRRAKVIVADIAHDPLWQDLKDLPLAANLRACWSTPIMAANGLVLGTFAVYYHEVRSPRAVEVALVDGMVHIIMLAMQRHRNELALKQANQRLQEAQRIAHLGHWELDLRHNTVCCSEEVLSIFEVDPQKFGAAYETFLNVVHPEDRAVVDAAYHQHLRDRQPYNLVHRLQMSDGQVKHVHALCETTYGADGTPLISQGIVQDITQQREAEIRRERAEASVRQVVEGTAAFTGEEFFPALVCHIAAALGVRYVAVSRATAEGFQVLAFFADGKLCQPPLWPYDLVPCCHQVLQSGSCCHPAGIQALYPHNTLFADLQVESYLGIRLRNATGEPTGNLCIFHDAPLVDPDWAQTLVSIFAARAGAELERLLTGQALAQLNAELETRVTRRTAELAEREALLQDFLDHANDLIQIVDIDTRRFKFVNQAWRDTLGYTAAAVEQLTCFDVLAPECHPRCETVLAQMRAGDLTAVEQLELVFVSKSGQRVVVEGNVNCRFSAEADGHQRPVSTRGIFRDITAKKAAEQELQRREARYRGLMQGAADAILLADLQGQILEANEKAEVLLGYSLAELTTLHFTQLHPPEELPRVTMAFAELLQGRTSILDVPCQRQNGTTVPVDITGNLIDLDGEILVLGIFRDISERKAAEQALQESQQFLRTVLDTVPLAVFWKDRSSRYLGANQCFLRDATLRSTSELVGKTDFDMPWGATEAAAYRADDRIVMDTGEAQLGILATLHRHDGTEIYVETHKLPLRNLAGEVIGVLGTYQDITARREAEISLRRQLAAIEAAIDGIAILQNERYLYLNSSHVELFGYHSNQELMGQSWRILYAPDALERFDQEIWPALYERMFWQGEVMAMRKDGTTFPQQLSLTLSADNLLICVSQDISDRKAAEAELHRTNAELARATRLKDEFLANMSHELRTPLNAILGMTEGLQEDVFGSLNERQLSALCTVERSANHLLSLINDILDVAKIESGQIHLDYSHVAIEQLCSSSLAFIKQQALKKRIQLRTHIPSCLPDLFVDEIRIRQVLLNLLTNAVKFTPEGGIVTLTVTLSPQEPGQSQPPYLRIAIADTGIGIAPENISKLFKPFVQIDSALNRKQTGTGLGLALVKQIVELHGGQVGLSSELGGGSCFTVDLPYGPQGPSDGPPASVPLTQGADLAYPKAYAPNSTEAPLVLLAEDNAANVATTSSYLTARGYRLLIANDGQEAIDLALFHHPDVILMDIQMPGMDGLAAIRQIRQQESLRNTLIIALTAFAMKGDRERCLAAGADSYFSKPVRLKQLVSAIKELLTDGCPE